MTDPITIQAELDAKNDIIRAQLDEIEELRAQLATRDTSMLPPPSERETGPRGTLLELIEGIAVLSTTVETLGRMAMETRKCVDEMPALVRVAAAEGASDAVLSLVQRVVALEDWRRRSERACEDCPNRAAL